MKHLKIFEEWINEWDDDPLNTMFMRMSKLIINGTISDYSSEGNLPWVIFEVDWNKWDYMAKTSFSYNEAEKLLRQADKNMFASQDDNSDRREEFFDGRDEFFSCEVPEDIEKEANENGLVSHLSLLRKRIRVYDDDSIYSVWSTLTIIFKESKEMKHLYRGKITGKKFNF